MRHTHRNGLPALRLEADLPAIATRRPARVGPAPKPCMSVIRFPVSPAAGPRASACLGGRYGRALTINRHDSDLKRTELVISSASHGTRIRLRVERRRRRRVVPRSGGHLGLHCTCLQPYSTGASCHVQKSQSARRASAGQEDMSNCGRAACPRSWNEKVEPMLLEPEPSQRPCVREAKSCGDDVEGQSRVLQKDTSEL
jgi:hypothetical protein